MRTKEQMLQALFDCSQSDDPTLRAVAKGLIEDPEVVHGEIMPDLFEIALISDGRW